MGHRTVDSAPISAKRRIGSGSIENTARHRKTFDASGVRGEASEENRAKTISTSLYGRPRQLVAVQLAQRAVRLHDVRIAEPDHRVEEQNLELNLLVAHRHVLGDVVVPWKDNGDGDGRGGSQSGAGGR